MEVFHIGTIAFETGDSQRELKTIGGITGYISELINYSISQKIKIGFIGKIYNYAKLYDLEYIKVQDNVTSTNKFLIKLFLKSITTRISKNAIIHAHRPDHLAAFIFLNKRKSIVTLHGQQAHTVSIRKGMLTRFVYRKLEKYAFRKANALIAVDSITKNFYAALYPQHKQKIFTISTGVNTKLFYPGNKVNCRKELNFKLSDKIIIYVGRIEPPKKVDIIIRAFQKLVNQDNTYKLVLVGDGILMKQIKKLSSDLNLDDNIYYMGVRKRIELPQLFCSADASVLISGNEGSPLSVKESLACGVPVVANNVGDISEIIKNSHNGFIVNPEDINEIAKKLKLAINLSVKMKQTCVDSIQKYSIETVNQKVINLYKKILDE